MMRIIPGLYFFILLFSTSCSTLHTHKVLYLDKQSESGDVVPKCMNKGKYGDLVKVQFGQEQLKLFFQDQNGFSMIGPIFVPMIPMFWLSSEIDSLGLKVMPDNGERSNLKIDFKKWGIRLDDQDEVFPTISDIEKIDGDPNNVIPNIGGGKWLVYEFSKRSMPKKVELIMDGVVIGQKMFPKKKIVFYEDTPWHYVPLVFIHTEWPYTHDLPCD